MDEINSLRSALAGLHLSLVAVFLGVWAVGSGANSTLPLVGFLLLVVGTVLVWYGLTDES